MIDLEPHHPPGEPYASRKRSHRDLIAGLTSGFVGALALATSLYNVYLQRQPVSAAVRPNLEWSSNVTDRGLTFSVANRGTGPALVKTFRVSVDGKPMPSWPDALALLQRTNHVTISMMADPVRTLSPGGELTTVGVADPTAIRETLLSRRRLKIELCYCSTLAGASSPAECPQGPRRS